MTVSMLCCRDLATDLPTVAEMQRHYRFILEKSATPISAMFPWFPAPAKLAQLASGKALFTILSNYIEERTKAPVSTSDAVGILQAQGLNNADITAFSMTAFLTGIANTSVHGKSSLSTMLLCQRHILTTPFSILGSPLYFFPLPMEICHLC